MAIQHDVERDWVDADRDSVTLQVAEHGYIDKSKPALLAPAVMEQLGVDNGDTITVTGENAVETRVWEAEHPDDEGDPLIHLRKDVIEKAVIGVLEKVTVEKVRAD